MSKKVLRRPFFVVNPKSYLFGDELEELAVYCDKLALEYDFDVIFTAPFADISNIAIKTNNLLVCAQHMDGIKQGRGMGHVLPESIKNAGAVATFLNHAEHPQSLTELSKSIDRANELGILTIVCADGTTEAKAIASLKPDIIVSEPTELIGTGNMSDEEYIKSTNTAIKNISPSTLVLQAAGISSGENVYDAILMGADGTGGTSGIVCSSNPKLTLTEMFEALSKARKEI